MVPPEAFLMSSAQAISDGFSGCCGGTQLESLSATGLSWAIAGDAAAAQKAAAIATATRASREAESRCGWAMVSSSRGQSLNAIAPVSRSCDSVEEAGGR